MGGRRPAVGRRTRRADPISSTPSICRGRTNDEPCWPCPRRFTAKRVIYWRYWSTALVRLQPGLARRDTAGPARKAPCGDASVHRRAPTLSIELQQALQRLPVVTNDHQRAPVFTSGRRLSLAVHWGSPVIASFHWPSPAITSDHQRSPAIPSDHQRSPAITSDPQRSPEITSDHQRSPAITGGHQRSPAVTGGHRRSPVEAAVRRRGGRSLPTGPGNGALLPASSRE